MSELSAFSSEYTTKTPLKHRQKLGQFFTKKSLRDLAINPLPVVDGATVAELSCGSGEFVDSILEHFPNCHVDAFEIDPPLAAHCEEKYKGKNVTVYGTDTLSYKFTKKYKYVVGNPPYFEYDPDETVTNAYKEVINGRVNIYSLFVKLGIDILEDGGYLSFVIPMSMLNGRYFSKLREYIVQRCSIVDIILKDSDHFDEALQHVMVLVLRKGTNDGKFVFNRNGILIFTPKWKELVDAYKGSRSIRDLGFFVKTGTVVWNQHKEKLSSDPKDILLVWSHNIGDTGIVIPEAKGAKPDDPEPEKKQYIKWDKPLESGTVIAVNRVTGVGDKAVVKACLVSGERFVCENHVNVICSKGNTTISIDELLPHIKSKDAITVMRKITGNTQISKTELEVLFPIWGVESTNILETE